MAIETVELGYVEPQETEHVNESMPNRFGVTNLVTYPDLLNGTNCKNPAVPEFKPKDKVDVIIVGGPVGLTLAACLARQGISLRIYDRSPHPLKVGRADALQPRTMEVLRQIGIIDEVFSLGPRMEHTVVYKDGKQHVFVNSHQSPGNQCRYQGLHVVTQTETEHALIRDLIRHDVLVERPCNVKSYSLDDNEKASEGHPITATVENTSTGQEVVVKARFIVGCDGAHSMIRKSLPITFDGIKTDLHWGIVDAVFDTDWPHAWTFGTVLNSNHGGVLVIPRERGMVRLYAQLMPEPGKTFDKSKWGPEEVLEVLNAIFAPYYLKYASPVDWFTILTITERVADTFSYKDRIFLAGDSCHVHSAKGAFGMNTGILDAHNLAWKLALYAKGIAKSDILQTYDAERRENAIRAVRTSARYLRFVGNCTFQTLDGSEADVDETAVTASPGEDPHVAFFRSFAQENTGFLLGLDVDYPNNVLNAPMKSLIKGVRSGYRAPDPRVAISRNHSGRLHDTFGPMHQFTVLVFASNMQGSGLKSKLHKIDSYFQRPTSFLRTYSRLDILKLVLVVRSGPSQVQSQLQSYPFLKEQAQIAYDDQLPPGFFGGDAHSLYGVVHSEGAIVVVRPDTFVGTMVPLDGYGDLEKYFSEFLL